MDWPTGNDGPPRILLSTLKTAVAVALISYGASLWFAQSSMGLHGSTLLAGASLGGDDPVTTGSIGRVPEGVKLDPCALSRRP